jgi:AhpD family alkylhydroperoxidase
MSAPKLNRHAIRAFFRALGGKDAMRARVVDRKLREAVAIHVSSLNSCAVCSSIHERKARAMGMSDDEIRAAQARESAEASDPRARTALRYAEIRTFDQEKDFPDEVALFEAEFGDAEQRELRAVIDQMTFNNRFNNTWESILPGAAERRKKLGI